MDVPRFECFKLAANAPQLIPGRSERQWMDQTHNHFAYRCTPLTIANSSGWELLNPCGFSATWHGRDGIDDIVLKSDEPEQSLHHLSTIFGHGILTFHPGYLFRTDPGWVVWARGIPNRPKAGIQPLEGIVETSWLQFTFTMNWKFMHPGTVRFAKDEPFCFVTLVPSVAIENVQPSLRRIDDEPQLHAEYRSWAESRRTFTTALKAKEAEAARQKWQKHYLVGKSPSGRSAANADHRTKRTLKAPQPIDARKTSGISSGTSRPPSSSSGCPIARSQSVPSPIQTEEGGANARALHFIAGLPNSGTTLLAALLRQNPAFHAGTVSPLLALCDAMDNNLSNGVEVRAQVSDIVRARLLAAVADTLYSEIPQQKIVFDINAIWTSRAAMTRMFAPQSRIICCVRDIGWIIDSIENMHNDRATQLSRMFGFQLGASVYSRSDGLMDLERGAIGQPWVSLREAWFGHHAHSLVIVPYDELVSAPKLILEQLYSELGLPSFTHDFDNVESDAYEYHELLEKHERSPVPPRLGVRPRALSIPPDLFAKYAHMCFWKRPIENGHGVRILQQDPIAD